MKSLDKKKKKSIFMNVPFMKLWFRYWRHVWLQDIDGRYEGDILDICVLLFMLALDYMYLNVHLYFFFFI